MKISAICTDIDGTLLDKTRQLSTRTLKAFAALPSDFPIILASSRMPGAMAHLLEEFGRVANPLICYNGGFVIRSKNEDYQQVSSTYIDANTCREIFAFASETSVHISLYSGDSWFAPSKDKWTVKEEMVTKVKATIDNHHSVLGNWEENSRGAHKVMCMGTAEEIQWLYDQLIENFSSSLHLYRSKDTYIEIAPKSISKASGLRQILAEAAIPMAEVLAFGDNYNDISLIEEVGYGVAVANARDEVKKVAKEITESNTADGVAITIEKLLL
ncbi:Cof-type HAD-IIB family hydrolase [Cyclobacterium amurskyense]|uniref:Hydrolase (HAD superfamily) n=1 Tax=Cyclobacterium amurskyense TaxID=320787 RepID=A0A0H4PFP3_9BACT|nr:Cof-type HAD-IIB family hydrolase [Cyclobacterium amurskyense]AKP51890.1 Hydrolase (HAD superfamily) [Cyclobacterium amurskyense]